MEVPFTIAANPGTDLWKKPPTTNDDNAPYTTHSKGGLLELRSASVTFTTSYVVQFDQAGLLLRLTHPGAPTKWLKAGVEFFEGQPRLSVVCCDRWADWSVAPLPAGPQAEEIRAGARSVTVRAEKVGDAFWVFYVDEAGVKTPLREVAWFYGHEEGAKAWQIEVAALVARPNKEVDGPLEATFQALDVEWAKQ